MGFFIELIQTLTALCHSSEGKDEKDGARGFHIKTAI